MAILIHNNITDTSNSSSIGRNAVGQHSIQWSLLALDAVSTGKQLQTFQRIGTISTSGSSSPKKIRWNVGAYFYRRLELPKMLAL